MRDLDFAKTGNVSSAVFDRIALNRSACGDGAGLRDVAALADPVREVVRCGAGPMGCKWAACASAGRYQHHLQARPNVTADAAALA
jgi:gamma-glutamyl phosphate reductase